MIGPCIMTNLSLERISFWWSVAACNFQKDIAEILANPLFLLAQAYHFLSQFLYNGSFGKLKWSLWNTASHTKASRHTKDPKESEHCWLYGQEKRWSSGTATTNYKKTSIRPCLYCTCWELLQWSLSCWGQWVLDRRPSARAFCWKQ